jgi:hypothetical protein
MTREQMLRQLAARGFDSGVLGRGMSTEALSSLVRFSERRPVRVRTTCYRQFAEDGQGDDDAGLDVDDMINQVGRRGADVTPFVMLLDKARRGQPVTEEQVLAVITEILRITEDQTPVVDDDDAAQYADRDDSSAVRTSGFSDADVAAGLPDGQIGRLMEGGTLPRKYAEAVRSRSRMYYTETGPGSPVAHSPQNYAGFYECFAESFRKLGIDKATFVRDSMKFGRQAQIGKDIMPPAKPAPQPPSKFAEHSDGRRVEMYYDRHARDLQKFGIQRAEFVHTFQQSGQTADEFLRGTK